MPGYCKSSRKTFTVTNQDAVIYPVIDKNGCITGNELKLPGFKKKERIPINYVGHKSDLRMLTFKPYYDKYIMTFVIEDMAAPFYPDMPYMAGLDFGTDNIAAIACTDNSYNRGELYEKSGDFIPRKTEQEESRARNGNADGGKRKTEKGVEKSAKRLPKVAGMNESSCGVWKPRLYSRKRIRRGGFTGKDV